MNPQDLITQVKDKKKEANTENTADSVTSDSSQANVSSYFQKRGATPDKKENSSERGVFNSPRQVSENDQPIKIPWKEDHLLPPPLEHKKGLKCLVLDLDETLVHSSFKPVDECDFIIPVEIENYVHQVYVSKRPGVDEFMKRCGEIYEVVIFTASLSKYADPVLDLLDKHKAVDWRLFRESCSPFKGSYVKDMGRMGRDLTKIMIVDNSPHSYAFNPENAIPVESWFDDRSDKELLDMIPILEKLAEPEVTDVRDTLKELQISGLEALKQEFQVSLEDEYTDTDDEYTDSDDSGTANESASASDSDAETTHKTDTDNS